MPFRIILESASESDLPVFFQLLNSQHDIICLHSVSRVFMDALVCPLLHEGYGYVYIESGDYGICTAWRQSIFEATKCHSVSLQHAYDEPIWSRVLSFFCKKSHNPSKVSFVRLHQINTSREIWVINCASPQGTPGFIANPHFFNILVERIVYEAPCILAGSFKGTIRDEMVLTGWMDACSGIPGDDTIMARGGLIQIQETLGGDNSGLAQFY